jgi:hypothetical protein
MYKQTLTILFFLFAMVCMSCKDSEYNKIEKAADSFAINYYNWNYLKCSQFVTHESQKYLKFKASNVTDEDIKLLRSMSDGAKVEIENNYSFENDSAVTVKMKVYNFCYADTIGHPSKVYDYAEATLLLLKRSNKWKVVVSNNFPKMAFPQQSVSQDHGRNPAE